jgi:anti-sigma factor RsiW
VADAHEAHDLEVLVAFADGELHGTELDDVASQVTDCPACAELVADLRSLVLAHRQLPPAARPRDYRLTAADAERLQRMGPEPHAVASRLAIDMTGTPTTHPTHDPELIAAAVGGVLEPSERRQVDSWLSTCRACAELHSDLLSIASAQRTVPTPARPRDFQLTPADAHRLRPHGIRAILAAIGSSRDAFTKPLAVGLTTLGLVGLLVGTVPVFGSGNVSTILSTVGAPVGAADASKNGDGDGTVFGGQDLAPPSAAAAAPIYPDASAAASAAPQPDAVSGAPEIASAAPREVTGASASEAADGGGAVLDANGDTETLRSSAQADGPSGLLIGSVLLLVAGLVLFGARRLARRLRAA